MKNVILFLLIIAGSVPYVQAAKRQYRSKKQIAKAQQQKPKTNIFNQVVEPIDHAKAARDREYLAQQQQRIDFFRDITVNGVIGTICFSLGWAAREWWNKKYCENGE